MHDSPPTLCDFKNTLDSISLKDIRSKIQESLFSVKIFKTFAIMSLHHNEDDAPGLPRDRSYSDAHAIVGRTTSSPTNSYHTARAATENSSSSNNVVLTPVKKQHTHNYRHHHHHHGGNNNRPRSKSESDTHHRSTYKKKGTHSPGIGGHHCVQSPTSVSTSPKFRCLGKMWIRPVPVKNLVVRQQQQQRLSSDSPHLHSAAAPFSSTSIPFIPDFGGQPSAVEDHHQQHQQQEDDMMMLCTTPNSSFDTFQRESSELNPSHLPSSTTVFTFGESGKPLTPLIKRNSPTSVI